MLYMTFMRQKRKETVQLIWITPHGPFIHSDHSSKCCASSLEQMCLLGHSSTKQRCEIQCEALEFSSEHKLLCDLN